MVFLKGFFKLIMNKVSRCQDKQQNYLACKEISMSAINMQNACYATSITADFSKVFPTSLMLTLYMPVN